jgi:hypothetical protein
MNFDFQSQFGTPQTYAISPESIQPQYISPESIQPQYTMPYAISPESIQPQNPYHIPSYHPYPYPYPRPRPIYPPYQPPYPYPPMPPYPPTRPGGCLNQWSRVRLRDGRTLNIYVTSIAEKSIGGFLANGRQIALDLDEIVEMTC